MKVWQVEIGTEEGGPNMEVTNGLAEDAQEAIRKAMEFAKTKCGHKDPYPSRVTDLGDQVF